MSYLERRMKDAKVNYMAAAPDAFRAMVTLAEFCNTCGLDPQLSELIKTRVSQINGCAFCVEMHTRDARAAGESEDRLYLLSTWRESDAYTSKERAALAWAEALTLLTDHGQIASALEAAQSQFTDAEIVNLTVLLCTTHTFNRLNIGFEVSPSAEKPLPDGAE